MNIRFYQLLSNQKRNEINKTLPSEYVIVSGELRDSIDISNPSVIIDISSTANINAVASTSSRIEYLISHFKNHVFSCFNYVYLDTLHRYYFVKKITLLRKNIISIDLHIDVLKTFEEFIYGQTAFVSRNKTNYNVLLPDERRIVTNESELIYTELQNIVTPEIGFDTAFGTTDTSVTDTAYNFVVVSWDNQIIYNHIKIDGGLTRPVGNNITNLPSVRDSNFAPYSARAYILNRDELAKLLEKCARNDSVASMVSSIYAYPFNFKNLYPANIWTSLQQAFIVGENVDIYPNHLVADGRDLLLGYVRLADFVIPDNDSDFNDLEPYSIYELYIPYYGYYKLDYNAIRGHEIYIFMTLNYEVGTATFLLYDKTEQQLLTSLQAQVGIEIPKTVTNILEVKNRHDANNTSLGLGILTSVLAVIGGVFTGGAMGALAVAGGAIAGGKVIGNYAVSEKSNIVTGSRLNFNGNTAPLFSPQRFFLRQTRRKIQYSLTNDFLKENGGVLNELYLLTNLRGTGYTEIADIPNINYLDVLFIPTDTEVDEIMSLLKSGVIF